MGLVYRAGERGGGDKSATGDSIDAKVKRTS